MNASLASNSWSVWMETYLLSHSPRVMVLSSCFQFVKRMNGNLCSVIRIPPVYALLPIREAYEWKPSPPSPFVILAIRLASNSWSVWMETFDTRRRVKGWGLASNSWSVWMETLDKMQVSQNSQYQSCFQFVKRMNGNYYVYPVVPTQPVRLASNSWSVWMETILHTRSAVWGAGGALLPIREAYEWKLRVLPQGGRSPNSCFQFVKRMNGNPRTARINIVIILLTTCFQFVKRMNGNSQTTLLIKGSLDWSLLPIREAYEWKRGCNQLGNLSADFLLPIREAYEWKPRSWSP